MCTVSVKVNEAVLREMMPELDSNAAIRKWVQQLIDLRIREISEQREDREIAAEDEATISIEEAREMTLQAVREEYAKA